MDAWGFANSQGNADAKLRLFGVPFEDFMEVVPATTLPNERGDHPRGLVDTD